SADAGVDDVRGDQIVQADPQLGGERQEQLEAGLPLARLEARESARRHLRPLCQLVERPALAVPVRAQPQADLLQPPRHRSTPSELLANIARFLAIQAHLGWAVLMQN